MIRFAADENFNWNVVRGIRQQDPSVDILTVQEAGMQGAPDEDVLAWAESEGRVLLSHDTNTMKAEAEARMRDGRSMCGLIFCDQYMPLSQCIEEIIDICTYEDAERWDNRIDFLPLR